MKDLLAKLEEAECGSRELAYRCFDGDECSIIVFAENRGRARSRAANLFDCGFTEVDSVKRAPEFDKHSPGPIPAQAFLDAGWWLYCSGCEATVLGDDPERPAVIDGEDAYCSQACHDRIAALRARALPGGGG